ncbi:MAG: RNA 2',3'-cyclic phosphodiesterase [Clostridia bacterium]|nr:RNA 2',3'-cyclic phosphodiesterase [Clostridia bacterium]
MRLFVAVCLNDEMKKALTEMQSEAKRLGMRGSLTPGNNMHITLAFIGEYGRPDEILRIMREIPFDDFEIRLNGSGSFGDILWGGVICPKELTEYTARLRELFEERGIPFDGKPFRPHITLARKTENIPAGIVPREESMKVSRISLMRSDRGRDGKVYYREIGSAISVPDL